MTNFQSARNRILYSQNKYETILKNKINSTINLRENPIKNNKNI